MKLSTLKELCETWEIKDECEIRFGINGETHEVGTFFYVNNTIILEEREEDSSANFTHQLGKPK